jgi:hypothetical protein
MKSIEKRIKKLEEKINPGIKKNIEKIISKIGLLYECYIKACPTLKCINPKEIRKDIEEYLRKNQATILSGTSQKVDKRALTYFMCYANGFLNKNHSDVHIKLSKCVQSWNGKVPEKLTRMLEEEEKNEKL